MALGSENARNAVLDASLSGTDAPASLYLALFAGDPATGGVEITGGSYARVEVPKANWAAASGGSKANSASIAFPTSTATGWTGTATHAALMSTASGAGDRWDVGPLGASITVSGSGTTVTFAIGALIVSEA